MPRQRSSILVQAALPGSEESPSFARLYVTERQLEILSWVQRGKSARDIGSILGISPRTVEHQLERVCESLEVRTRLQAVLKMRDLGVLA